MNKVAVVIGTTGVGKSKLSIELAKQFNGEVVNADSMQMYEGIPIISNKHPIEEREGVPHHVMDHVRWDEEYFVHRFQKEALETIAEIHSRGKLPIIVGGTNYYLQSLLFNERTVEEGNVDFAVTKTQKTGQMPEEQRRILENPSEDKVWEFLNSVDPEIAKRYHPNDARRVKRMVEIYFETGQKPSEIYKQQKPTLRFDTVFYWLWSEQRVLDARLDARVDDMVRDGALDEVKQLYAFYNGKQGQKSVEHGVLQVIGFKEFLPWLQGTSGLNECIEQMKLNTRKYSKRQVKWIKNTLLRDLWSQAGKMCILDTTDLGQWAKVSAFAMEQLEPRSKSFEIVKMDSIGDKLGSLARSNGGAKNNLERFECDVCVDRNGNNLVLMGEESWQGHLGSRRHRKRKSVQAGSKGDRYEEMRKKSKMAE